MGLTLSGRRKKNVLNHEANEDIDEPEDKFHFVAEMVNPEEKFIKSQKIDLVRQVVETLKPRYRTLIQMRYFEEHRMRKSPPGWISHWVR